MEVIEVPDIEKVIKGLECCYETQNCKECPYFKFNASCQDDMDKDALELLKERQKAGHWTVLEDCSNSGIYCSECNCKIFDYTHKPMKKLSQYCPHCGSRNEQFFRDGEVVFR